MANRKSFTYSFHSAENKLITRYAINRELDFVNEFIKFADNTNDEKLLDTIFEYICKLRVDLLKLIKDYETNNEENTVESSN